MSEFQDQVEVHFPTTVMIRQHQDMQALNQQLFSVFKSMQDKYQDTELNEVHSDTITTKGGFQTPTRVNVLELSDAPIQRFRSDVLMPAIKAYLQHHFKDAANELNPWPNGWSNIIRAGDWQAPHCHPSNGTVASGVYYVRMPELSEGPEGQIEFINPMLESWHHGYPFNRRIKPQESMMILFPPWYVHFVHPLKTDAERCVIAFDVLSQKPGLNLVF